MMMMMAVSCDHDSDDDDGDSVTFHFLSSPLIISILAEEKQVPLILDSTLWVDGGASIYLSMMMIRMMMMCDTSSMVGMTIPFLEVPFNGEFEYGPM